MSVRDRTRSGGPSTTVVRPALGRWWRSRFGYRIVLEYLALFYALRLYNQGRALSRTEYTRAYANADHLIGIEKFFGIYTEQWLQNLVIGQRWLIGFLNDYYVYAHWVVTPVVLVWVYVWRFDGYAKVRRVIIGSMALGLVGHVLFPLAPPRMIGSEGFVDALAVFGPDIRSGTSSSANRIAAMPSLHFGWAVLVAAAIIMNRRTRFAWVALVHPFITLMAIIVTANHFWADAIVGGAIIALLYALDRRWVERTAGVPAHAGAP